MSAENGTQEIEQVSTSRLLVPVDSLLEFCLGQANKLRLLCRLFRHFGARYVSYARSRVWSR
jgi:hypothetical protein